MAIIVRKNKHSLSYQPKVRDREGKWFRSKVFETREEAEREHGRLLTLKGRGSSSADARERLNVFWQIWAAEGRTEVSEGWRISQDQMYRSYIEPILGDRELIDITTPDITRLLNRVKEMGKSDQTRKHVYALLNQLFESAVGHYDILSESPVKAKYHRPRVATIKRTFLPPEASWKLLKATREHYLGPAIWTQLLAGLRPSEVQGLQGKALLYDSDQILISRIYNTKTKRIQDYPKQGDWSCAPMAPVLKEYLRGLKRGPEAFVATGPDGRSMLSYNTYCPALKRLCRKLSIPVVTPHELRHSCTEIWVQAGASQIDIQRLLGHGPGSNATSRYMHRTDDRFKALFPNVFPNGDKQTFVSDGQEADVLH